MTIQETVYDILSNYPNAQYNSKVFLMFCKHNWNYWDNEERRITNCLVDKYLNKLWSIIENDNSNQRKNFVKKISNQYYFDVKSVFSVINNFKVAYSKYQNENNYEDDDDNDDDDNDDDDNDSSYNGEDDFEIPHITHYKCDEDGEKLLFGFGKVQYINLEMDIIKKTPLIDEDSIKIEVNTALGVRDYRTYSIALRPGSNKWAFKFGQEYGDYFGSGQTTFNIFINGYLIRSYTANIH